MSKLLPSIHLDSRKLSYVKGKIQLLYFDMADLVVASCQSITTIELEKSIFDTVSDLTSHREIIHLLPTTQQKLTIPKISFQDLIFDVQITFLEEERLFECFLQNQTNFYTRLNELEELHQATQIELINEKLELTKELEFQKTQHQKELAALHEKLRLNWTNALVNPIKKSSTVYFTEIGLDENLRELAQSFEKISGLRLLPPVATQISCTVGYVGNNKWHYRLIQRLANLVGATFSSKQTDICDVIFVEDTHFVPKPSAKKVCVIQSLENTIQQAQVFSKEKIIFTPLYPYQIYEQLLVFNTANTMNYHEKIDLSIIYDLVDNEPILVQNMLQILHKNLIEYPPKIRQEFEEGQLEQLRKTIHKFKSCTAYTGLTEFNTTLSEIEASQENGWTIAQIEEKLNYILQAIPVIKTQVEEKLEELAKELS